MIVPTTKAQLAVLLAIAAAAPAVNAHGSMSLPKPTFAIQGDTTQFGLTVDSSALKAPSGMSFTTDPTSNTNAFTAALKASSYKSVKALIAAKGVPISGANKECGITSATGAKQPLPAMVEWSHGSGEGFTPSHEGPCEVWCDEDLVFSDTNCAKNYPAAPAKLPYKKELCAGKSVLKTVWLALHSPTWQAYINCAAIEGGSSSGGSTTPSTTPKATSKTPTTTKKPTTTPKATSKAPATQAPVAGDADDEDCEDDLPVAGDDDEDCDDELEIPDTPAPATGGGEVGGEADDEDCEDDLPVAGDNDDEDCEDDLPVAGDNDDEDCDEELDVAGEAVRTSDLDFSSISAADKSDIGTVESY